MRRLLIAAAALTVASTTAADEPQLTALYRFYDENLHEHVYCYGEGEPAEWRKLPHMKNETILGYVSTVELPGTKRLWRAIRPDGKHYFYTDAPKKAENVRLEEFVVYVWKRPRRGRKAIHACCLPDGTDMMFDPSLDAVREFTKGTLEGIGVKRIEHRSVFYLADKP